MKKLIAFLLCLELLGCSTTSSVTPNLSLGMSKQDVLAKCGNPIQAGAIKDKDGRILESFMYQESNPFAMTEPRTVVTYVYFSDGKVIYYGGNPNMPNEQTLPSQQSHK